MSVIKINAITVPASTEDELARRFIARQQDGAMQGVPGFEGFELFRPTDAREQWLVVTRWNSDEDFTRWMTSEDFRRAHEREIDEQTGRRVTPVGTHAELWSYRVAVSS